MPEQTRCELYFNGYPLWRARKSQMIEALWKWEMHSADFEAFSRPHLFITAAVEYRCLIKTSKHLPQGQKSSDIFVLRQRSSLQLTYKNEFCWCESCMGQTTLLSCELTVTRVCNSNTWSKSRWAKGKKKYSNAGKQNFCKIMDSFTTKQYAVPYFQQTSGQVV